MASTATLTRDFVERPFWWDDAPPGPTSDAPALSSHADVAIIGAGIAGLTAAIHLARAGLDVTVIDRESVGWGASSRNGGALSGAGSLGRAKPDLYRALGRDRLNALFAEAETAFDDFESFVRTERLDCDYARCGRFIGAHAPKAMETLRKRAALLNETGRDRAELVEREAVREELATDRYHGGLRLERAGRVHPARYVAELARVARETGARLHGGVEALSVAGREGALRVATSAGEIVCDKLMVATNGYTGDATPWHRDRLIPVASYMIATQEIGEERVRACLRQGRVYGDTKRVLYYFRASPDGKRILFGGRASFSDASARQAAPTLRDFLVGLFPQLDDVQVTHAWKGNVAFAFDFFPHVGAADGVHYALACNGSGVVMMTHLGACVARRMLGRGEPSAFAALPFPSRPFYRGRPWFLPIVGASYQLRDRLDGWRAGSG